MNTPGFTAEDSLYKTNVHYQLITQRAGPGGGQAVIPQRNCYAYAEVAVGYGHLALKTYAQGDILLAQQYIQEYLNWATLYQACEEMALTL